MGLFSGATKSSYNTLTASNALGAIVAVILEGKASQKTINELLEAFTDLQHTLVDNKCRPLQIRRGDYVVNVSESKITIKEAKEICY